MFDSASATLGIVAAGIILSDHGPAALRALQRARYVDGQNTADAAAVAEVLAGAGFADAAARVWSRDPGLLTPVAAGSGTPVA